MLRLGTMTMAAGDDGKRLVWAMVYSMLMLEAAGKGFAVQRNVMMRIGGRGSMSEVLTKRRLRQILADENAARAMCKICRVSGKACAPRRCNGVASGKRWKPASSTLRVIRRG